MNFVARNVGPQTQGVSGMMTSCKPTLVLFLVTLVASFNQFLLICRFIWDICTISDKRELLADNSSPASDDGSLLNGETLIA